MANKFAGTTENAALDLNGLVMAIEGGIRLNPTFRVTNLDFKPDTTVYEYQGAGTSAKSSCQLNSMGALTVDLFIKSLNPYVEQAQLRALEGDDKPIRWTEASMSLTPAAENPVWAFLGCIKPFPAGGKIGEARELSFDVNISGGYDYFVDLPLTGATLAAGNPTAATIDLTWDYDAVELASRQGQTRVVSYEVWQSLTTATGFTKVSTTDANGIDVVPNPDGNFYQAESLAASTPYFFYVVAVDFYGFRSVISAEATTSTIA